MIPLGFTVVRFKPLSLCRSPNPNSRLGAELLHKGQRFATPQCSVILPSAPA